MKCTVMDKTSLTPLTLTCVSALIAGLIPATTQGQEHLQTIERAPENIYENERDATLAKFLEAGPISVRPHLYADTYYDDNLTLSRSHKREDWVWRIAPGALFGIGEFRGDKGNYVSIDYTMRGEIYTKYSDYNALDHYVIMNSGYKLSKLTLGLSQSYEIDHGKSIEAGAFVEQELFITQLTSKYEISEKTSVELNGRQSISSSVDQVLHGPNQDLASINEWVVESWGNYKPTEKLITGLGFTAGWRDIRTFDGNPSPNQTYEQILGRGGYEVSQKVHVLGSAGIQLSQFQDGDDKTDFIFSLGVSYHPLENTFLALEAYRYDIPSIIYSGRNYTLTGGRFSVKQVILEKYSLSLITGYEYRDYTKVSSTTTPNPDRQDNYFWFRPEADYAINERWQIGLFYQYRTKSSSDDTFDYSNNQAGLYSNYRF